MRVLSQADIGKYNSCIAQQRDPKLTKQEQETVKESLQKYRAKVFADDSAKVKEKRDREETIRGRRVRLVSDPSQRGLVPNPPQIAGGPVEWKFHDKEGALFAVLFDGESKPSEAHYHRSDLRLLCVVCDVNDGKYRCSKCQVEPYCSAECQKAAWREHKLHCSKSK